VKEPRIEMRVVSADDNRVTQSQNWFFDRSGETSEIIANTRFTIWITLNRLPA
jgi:hypothetical protein